jgi:hypothetical protein
VGEDSVTPMKNTILSLLVAVGITCSASAAVFTGDLNNGLVAYYSLNGNTTDNSGNGNDGVASYISYGLDRFGNANGAAYFGYSSGSSWLDFGNMGNITCPTLNSLNNYPITYSLWFNLLGYQNWLSYRGGGVMTLIGKEGSGYADAALAIYNDNGVAPNQISYLGSQWNPSTISPQLDQWNNLIFTISNDGTQTFYLNGSKVFQTNSPTILNCSSDIPFMIGASSSYGSPNHYRVPFNGCMSDIGIWNTALSSEEVSSLYTLQSVPEPSTYALFGIGAIGLLMVMRRKKTA